MRKLTWIVQPCEHFLAVTHSPLEANAPVNLKHGDAGLFDDWQNAPGAAAD